ncbi:MAG: DNA translocase FtsK [Thermodesulfobacteriota bacterium]|nr:DNA translocase FtsK [Thermodesulfobacteriota bacterium]
MAKIYTSHTDEDTIALVQSKGFLAKGPKWTVLRVALALSLKQPEEPADIFDNLDGRKEGHGEYPLDVLTGRSQKETDSFVDAFCALLSVYHHQDLFGNENEELYIRLLQRHIRRGLREIQTSWRESHDFHEFLLQEFFAIPSGQDFATGQEHDVEQLLQALEEFGLTAEVLDSHDGPRITRHTVRLTEAEDFSRLERKLEDLAFTLGIKGAGIFLAPAGEPKTVWLDVPRPIQKWKPVGYDLLGSWDAPEVGLPILLGVDIAGSPVVRDLVEAPHVLVAGTTGSGKSICLHALLLSLLANQSLNSLKLLLIDPKQVELAAYHNVPHLLAPIITDGVEAGRYLKNLVREMESREKLLASRNAREWRDLGDTAPPRIVIVVEELADLLAQVPDVEDFLVRLAQKSRAAGMHLVLATQRPDAATFSGLLRSNIPSRIALTVQKAADSRIILDEPGAEKLLGKGDMLVKWLGEKPVRVHGLNIQQSDISGLIRRIGKEGLK